MKNLLALIFIVFTSLADESWNSSTAIENTLTTYYVNKYESAAYLENKTIATNRFRTFLDINDAFSDDYDINIKLMVDANTIHHNLENDDSIDDDDVSVYRGYIEYIDNSHQLAFGKQTIPIGIGNLYSPLNIFNPIDVTSIEIEERSALNVLKYEYAINELSTFLFVYNNDITTLRLKYFIDSIDFGIVAIKNTQDDKDEDILGYEFEARLFESSFDFKSEAMIIKDSNSTEKNIMLGFNYGYEDLTLSTEYFYNSLKRSDEIAASLFYQLNGLWSFMITEIHMINTKDNLTIPSLQYSLSDNHFLKIGAVLEHYATKNENRLKSDSYFFQLVLNY